MTESNLDHLPLSTALISVSNREGLEPLIAELDRRSVRLIATGGTAHYIRDLGYWVTEISEYTDFPEIMNGRVKTLHPMVHGGILANRDDKKHVAAMKTHDMLSIDLVIINLYPFAEVIAQNPEETKAIENIDIGGPSMIRSAAKNHRWVTVLSDISQYPDFLNHLQENGGTTSFAYRQQLAAKAFTLTASYDSLIAGYLGKKHQKEALPEVMLQVMKKSSTLSYGENPHQQAAVYLPQNTTEVSLCSTKPLHGKALSYNNLLDAAAAMRAIANFDAPAAAIIKHNSPCGLAVAGNVEQAFLKALACDPHSAFGGVLAINRPLSLEMIEAWEELFLEVVIAPEVDRALLGHLKNRKNMRLLEVPINPPPELLCRTIAGGMLVQQNDSVLTPRESMRVVTKITPDEKTWHDLLFAWEAVRHVKSNAIVFARDRATVAIGGGQTSRYYSVTAAINNSRDYAGTQDSVVASDAFFPFPDALEKAITAGAKAVIQPGGSLRDQSAIDCADARGISMVFTDVRHFMH